MNYERAFEFIRRCEIKSDVTALTGEFCTGIAAFGFSASACGCWNLVGGKHVNRFFFLDWPPEVIKAYQEEDFATDDPFIFMTRRRMTPFTWDEVYADTSLPERSRRLYTRVRELGYCDGFAVPIHGPGGYQGLVTMIATRKIDLKSADRAILEAMSRAIHDRCRATIGFGINSSPPPELSERELECMRWVAAGKTDSEIGKILGISASTAHFHVEKVKQKLAMKRRTEAVAMLVLHGLI